MKTYYILVSIAVFAIAIIAIFFKISSKKENKIQQNKVKDLKTLADDGKCKVEFVQEFLDFDKIEKNVIVRENNNKFTMVLKCNGVNYDLMSETERAMIEEGFIGLLNFIQFPIQFYVQTRQVDLKDSLKKYDERIYKIRDELNEVAEEYKITNEKPDHTEKELKLLQYELANKKNLYEYAIDLRSTIETMSFSNNILQQKYYICLTYAAEEAGILTDLKDEELLNIAVQELYNRAESISGALEGCGIQVTVLENDELIDLLYIAFNRDDGEMYRFKDSIKSEFQRLFSTIDKIDEKKYNENVEYQVKAKIEEPSKKEGKVSV